MAAQAAPEAKILNHFARAPQALPEEKIQDITRQIRWISELLA